MSFALSPSSRGSLSRSQPKRSGPIAILTDAKWLSLPFLLFLIQALPYLSYRWVTDESWFTGTGYSIANGHGVANPGFGTNYLVSRFDAHPPGTALVIASAFRLFGASQITARLGSFLAGIAIVLFVYLLGRDVIGRQGACIASLIVATDNFVVLTARTARPEALTAMACLAALLAMKQYIARGKIFWAFASGVVMALGTMFHITLAGLLLSFGLLAIFADRRRDAFPLRGLLPYAAGYLLGLLPFALWIITAPLGPAGFREEYLNRASQLSLWARFSAERYRYFDALGLNILRGHGLEWLPVRLPILLFILAASYLLWKHRREWFCLEVLLLAPTALWLAYIPDKMSRYLVLMSPVLALAIGAAITAASGNRKLQRAVLIGSLLVVAAQFSANLFLLHQARNADYNKVTAELEQAIPPGETAYGTITFWMALRDHPYIAYERTDPFMAANQFHARYFIAGDRVMTNGLRGDQAFYVTLRKNMADIIARSTLVADLPDPYYGDLRVYRLP